MALDASVIKLVDDILASAIACNASDIHLELTGSILRVRYRIDGLLCDQASISLPMALNVVSRIKVLAHLDITQGRIPQDGKFRVTYNGAEIDVRVSSFPAIHGEKLVLRILDQSASMITLEHLGMQEEMLQQFKDILGKAHGFLLVAGPTGSGKTTTLYAALSLLNKPEFNIVTLEDPVEYNISGITQGQIHPQAGFTFAKGIRAMLRQDPDIVMIGEIRDRETARIAIEAALTGHLVLSTVHTNCASSVIMRLMDMGIEPFLLNASLSGVLAQRLARMLCVHCTYERAPTPQEEHIVRALELGTATVRDSKGCQECFQLGYKGRIGIFEWLPMSEALRSLIVQHPSFEAIEQQVNKQGTCLLRDDARKKVLDGLISLQEYCRLFC